MEKGPYQHYERPRRSRLDNEYRKSSKWGTVVVILLLVLMILVPLTLHSTGNKNESASQPAVKHVATKKTAGKKIQPKKPKLTQKKKPKTNKHTKGRKVPKKKTSNKLPQTYVVKSGDTISSIAKKYGLTEAQIRQANNLGDSSNINAGETIKLK